MTSEEPPTPRRRPMITCRNCQRLQTPRSQGLCSACWHRWNHAGRSDIIPDPMPPTDRIRVALAAQQAAKNARIEDYVFLRREGLTRAQAAARLGVSDRTITRYDAHLRTQADAEA